VRAWLVGVGEMIKGDGTLLRLAGSNETVRMQTWCRCESLGVLKSREEKQGKETAVLCMVVRSSHLPQSGCDGGGDGTGVIPSGMVNVDYPRTLPKGARSDPLARLCLRALLAIGIGISVTLNAETLPRGDGMD
jgi:hypothetical protein